MREFGNPDISVVVPTKNSRAHLAACLRALGEQTHPAAEVLVCDNFSTDGTGDVAASFGATVLLKGPERTAQRNYAALQARGTALLFIDSDMVLSPTVLKQCADAWAQGFRAATIEEVVVGSSVWARGRAFEKRLLGASGYYRFARFIDLNLFEQVGGYDENLLVNEDFDLHHSLVKAGAQITHVAGPIYHMETNLRLYDYASKFRYYSQSLDAFMDKRHVDTQAYPSLFSLLMKEWRNALSDPIGVCGFVVLKAIEWRYIGRRMRGRQTASGR